MSWPAQSYPIGLIITVMGCGGDRDKQKRPIMGSEAVLGSDFVVVTSDNPRSEDPLEIIRQVEQGVREAGFLPCRDEVEDCELKEAALSINSRPA